MGLRLLAGLGWLLITAGAMLGFPFSFHQSQWIDEVRGSLSWPLRLVLFLLLVKAGLRVLNRAKRHLAERTAVEQEASADPEVPSGRYILYLRSFGVDPRTASLVMPNILNAMASSRLTEEEQLVRALKKLAPTVVAIGDPRDDLPPLGATRMYHRSREKDWRVLASALIHGADFVVLTTGRTGGLEWEFLHVEQDVPLCRRVVLVCGGEDHYEHFRHRARVRGYFGRVELPPWDRRLNATALRRGSVRAAVIFDRAGRPRLVPLRSYGGLPPFPVRPVLEVALRRQVVPHLTAAPPAGGRPRPVPGADCSFLASAEAVPLTLRNPELPLVLRGERARLTAYPDYLELEFTGDPDADRDPATLVGRRRYPYAALRGVHLVPGAPSSLPPSVVLDVRGGTDPLASVLRETEPRPRLDPRALDILRLPTDRTKWYAQRALLPRCIPAIQEAIAAASPEAGNTSGTVGAAEVVVRSGEAPWFASSTRGQVIFDGRSVLFQFRAKGSSLTGHTRTVPLDRIGDVSFENRVLSLLPAGAGPELAGIQAGLVPDVRWWLLVSVLRTAVADRKRAEGWSE